jgi:predicted metal-dependent phosphoesterase TrpH
LKVDFHTHTYHSPDSITSISEYIYAARKAEMGRVVVTDHNTLRGAFEAKSAAPDLVIIGEEIQTLEGEFLAAFVTKEVPRGLEPMEALKQLKDQNAFISVSHPFDPRRSGWSLATLLKLAPLVDALEVLNARVFHPEYNEDARTFAFEHGLAGTAGSDAHHPSEIGRVYSELQDFHDSDSLRASVIDSTFGGCESSPLVHLYSARARWIKAFIRRQP